MDLIFYQYIIFFLQNNKLENPFTKEPFDNLLLSQYIIIYSI